MTERRDAYAAAVAYGKMVIGDWVATAPSDDTPAEILLRLFFGVREFVWFDGSRYHDAPDAALAGLAELAEANIASRELLREIVASKLLCGKPLTDPERLFAGRELRGSLPKITGKVGKKARKNFWKRAVALLLVREMVARYGLLATRNDASEPLSACDAAVEAYHHAGMKGISFQFLKEIWRDAELSREVELVISAIRKRQNEPAAVRGGLIG